MKTFIKLAVGLVIAVALMALFLRDVDLPALRAALGTARWPWLVVCLALALLHFVVRAWRWRYLLWPLRQRLPLWPLTEAILAGYAVTFLIPGRLGEVVRPAILARAQKLPLAGTLATVGLDRLLDGAALTFFLMIFLVLAPGTEGGIPPAVADGMRFWGFLIGGGMAAALVVLAVLSRFRHRLAPAPPGAGWMVRLRGAARSLMDGMVALHGGRPLAGALAGSLLIWTVLAGQAWAGLLAFDIDLPFTASFGLISSLAVGIALPTPAGAGGYHYAGKTFLEMVYGVGPSRAAAAILVLHLISVVPAIFLGGVVLLREGTSLGDLMGRSGKKVAAQPLGGGT